MPEALVHTLASEDKERFTERAPSDVSSIEDITSLQGWLQPLRTLAEVDARDETIDVYFCEIPVKLTGQVLDALRTIPNQHQIPLLHLRRVVKTAFLPPHLQRLCSPPLPLDTTSAGPTHHILLIPATLLSLPALSQLLQPLFQSNTPEASAPVIHQTRVPLHPPTSPAYAATLSATHWPTIFTNTNPFGPHPTIVGRATDEWSANAGRWMALALAVARGDVLTREHTSGSDAGDPATTGLDIGIAIIERTPNGAETIAAVARDARFAGVGAALVAAGNKNGNPAAHAVMRAIALVAQKRRLLAATFPDPTFSNFTPASQNAPYNDAKATSLSLSRTNTSGLSDTERTYLNTPNTLAPNGYLCLNLRVYTTHEPCVMCCMALLHARVGGVVFGRAMGETGAFGAEGADRGEDGAGACNAGGYRERNGEERERERGPDRHQDLDRDRDEEPDQEREPDQEQEQEREPQQSQHQEQSLGQEREPDQTRREGRGDESEPSLPQTPESKQATRTKRRSRYGLFWREDLNWRFLCWRWRSGPRVEYLGTEADDGKEGHEEDNGNGVDRQVFALLPADTHA